jgi:hypothetical protein
MVPTHLLILHPSSNEVVGPNFTLTHIQGKRIFIKDIAKYWIPTHNKPASIAPSLLEYKRGVGSLNSHNITSNQI